MNKHTKTPWALYSTLTKRDNNEDKTAIVCRGMVQVIAVTNIQEGFSKELNEANAEHIVKCVNSHEELVDLCKSYLEEIQANYELDPSGEIENKLKTALKNAE